LLEILYKVFLLYSNIIINSKILFVSDTTI